MSHRPLTRSEIALLEQRGCTAEDWGRVSVARDFSPGQSFWHVHFSGAVIIAAHVDEHSGSEVDGMFSGIRFCRLHNVRVGDHASIAHAILSNVDVGDHAVIDHVAAVACDGDTAFGNGARAHVLAEDGARSVPLWRGMSAQLAHLLCHLKGHPAAAAVEALIGRDVLALTRKRSVVGERARLIGCGELRNVCIGPGVRLEGVASLRDCHVEGGDAPARIGRDVAAERCLFLSGSSVDGGVRLEDCLVGEGTMLGRSLFAEHSLFFANSDFKLGEASCVMAGPFAVSHHRATLALACQSSFSNFGSGTNSSNHQFKLGARHGGVMRRGTRCGSGSYLFWPCDIGAFTTVVGRHTEHLDTVKYPFSLLVSKQETSVLVPGVNLFGSGCLRDGVKWLDRDRRAGIARPLDLVNPAVFSPYVMQAMEEGAKLLRRSIGMEADLRHGGAVIPSRRIRPALALYDYAQVLYIGERLLERAILARHDGGVAASDIAGVIAGATSSDRGYPGGRWRDWGGMLLCGADADDFVRDVQDGRLTGLDDIRSRLEALHAHYDVRALEWACWRWRSEHGDPDAGSVAAFFEKWRKAVRYRHERLVMDVDKEYSQDAMHGFGVEAPAMESFRRIRGEASRESLLALATAEMDGLLRAADNIK